MSVHSMSLLLRLVDVISPSIDQVAEVARFPYRTWLRGTGFSVVVSRSTRSGSVDALAGFYRQFDPPRWPPVRYGIGPSGREMSMHPRRSLAQSRVWRG